ncbi:hypothetical protein [Metabacillus fastidiosus]|uniref:hypothetical protein n=1 Tax=Metabacillus fastidiosus TaxID=1458 RepID=UPI003D28A922
MAKVGEVLASPENGWKRYEPQDATIKKIGKGFSLNSGTDYGTSTLTGANFSFIVTGTDSLRILTYPYYNRCNQKIKVNGGAYEFYYNNDIQYGTPNTFKYEMIDLDPSIEYLVEIEPDEGIGSWFAIDAIDIKQSGRVLHPEEVTDPSDLAVGKRIRGHYQVPSSGKYGIHSRLGEETSGLIPVNGVAIPDGDVYYICVDKDHLGRWVTVPDRVLQTAIKWDELNNEGVASGSGITFPKYRPKVEVDTLRRILKPSKATNPEVSYRIISVSDYYKRAASTLTDGQDPTGAGVYFNMFTIRFEAKEDFKLWLMKPSSYLTYGDGAVIKIRQWNGNSYEDYGTTVPQPVGERWWLAKELPEGQYEISTSASYEPLLAEWYLEYSGNLGRPTHNITVKLMSGGMTAGDVDSEWHRYIIGSDLGGIVTPGDNNMWNWQGVWSLTSTTSATGRGNRVVRGYSSVGGLSYVGSGNAATVSNCFRPLVIFEELAPMPEVSTDRTSYLVARQVGTNMEVTVAPQKDNQEVEWGLLVRRGLDRFYWSGYTQGTQLLTVNIPPRLFKDTSDQTITVEVLVDAEVVSTKVVTAKIVNDKPAIAVALEGYKLEVDIVDADGDPMYYEITLNGSVLSNGQVEGLLRYNTYLSSSDLNIGGSNEIKITAIDYYGDKVEHTIPFEGKYHGIMFTDVAGNYYSTDVHGILRRLVMDAFYARESSKVYEVRVVNTHVFPVKELTLKLDYYEPVNDTVLSIGDSATVVNKTEVKYDGVVGVNQSRSLFIKVNSGLTAVGKGKFRITSNARKV